MIDRNKLMTLPYCHEFKKYDIPKVGFFRVEKPNGKYILPGGWEQIVEKHLIIGEDDTTYINGLQPYEEGRWIGEEYVENYKQCILPIGIHKSRLIKWEPTQLSLFPD